MAAAPYRADGLSLAILPDYCPFCLVRLLLLLFLNPIPRITQPPLELLNGFRKVTTRLRKDGHEKINRSQALTHSKKNAPSLFRAEEV